MILGKIGKSGEVVRGWHLDTTKTPCHVFKTSIYLNIYFLALLLASVDRIAFNSIFISHHSSEPPVTTSMIL